MIEGTLAKPGPGGGGSGHPPGFRVTVPSVDVDWVGFADWNHETGEETRFVIVPLNTNRVDDIRTLNLNDPFDDDERNRPKFPHGGPVKPDITLHWEAGDVLGLFKGNATNFVSGTTINAATTTWPLNFTVNPLQPALTFKIYAKGQVDDFGAKAVDTIHGRVVNVDLDVDANYDGNITGTDESLEEKQGGLVCVCTNKLTPITLKLEPVGLPGKLTLSANVNDTRIKVWSDKARTKQVILPNPVPWTAATLPGTLYVEGISASTTPRDVELRLEYDDRPAENNALFKCADVVRLTVIKVEVDKIAFNYKPTSATDEALNIRENFTTPILVPEFVKSGQNKPAAYIKNKAVKMLVRLKVAPATITSLKIKGVSDDTNGSLGDATEKTVTFSGGISREGSDDASTTGIDESEYVEFTITGNTPNKVFKSEEAWKWIVTKVNGVAVSDMEVERTSGHKVYVLWDTPKSPWNQTVGDAKNPWVKALTFAIETAGGHNKNDSDALAAITSYLHTGHKLTYDIVAGDNVYSSSHLGGTMKLTKYIDKTLGTTINCYDQAAGVCTFGTLLGVGVTYCFMNPFGYINTVNLVGEGNCNNPFYGNPGITGGKITGADQVEPVRAAFGNHAFAKYGGNIYDACAGPHTGTRTEAQYVSDTVDTSTPVEANPPWCVPKAAGDAANITVGAVSGLE